LWTVPADYKLRDVQATLERRAGRQEDGVK